MESPKDLFSAYSPDYAKFRPDYPQELYEFIYGFVGDFENAWDCGTGNGQVAGTLSNKFKRVCASDISKEQLSHAPQIPNVEYFLCRGEETPFVDSEFDLITVGQAFHWFANEHFHHEVKRVAKKNAIIAVWGYELLHVGPDIDPVIDQFYRGKIWSYWHKERQYIEDKYTTLSFPYDEIDPVPSFSITKEWTLDELKGYLGTWSAVKKYIKTHGEDPVEDLTKEIATMWHENESKKVSFPLFLRIGRILR